MDAKLMRYALAVSWMNGDSTCFLIVQKGEILVAIAPPVKADQETCFRVLENLAVSNGVPEEEQNNLRAQLEEAFRKHDAETRQP
ncbi:MAG: hypothetical protein WC445_04125 [Patescibacteria group bacterium]